MASPSLKNILHRYLLVIGKRIPCHIHQLWMFGQAGNSVVNRKAIMLDSVVKNMLIFICFDIELECLTNFPCLHYEMFSYLFSIA